MSEITVRLLGAAKHRRRREWMSKMQVVADRVVRKYGTPRLGNYRDPAKEIFLILLSARTDERLYKRAHRRLFDRFDSVRAIGDARLRDIWKCISAAGLGRKRTKQVQLTAKRLARDFGSRAQRELRGMCPEEAYKYLTGLPGLGPKSALCVMMYSLDFDVFPVDVNVQRVLERMGAIPKGLKHYQAQRRAPGFVPAGRSKELHVGLVVHGRTSCTPHGARCEWCVLSDLCQKKI